MILGSLGEIVFEVSQLRVLNFDDYTRKTAAKYASHEVIGRPPVLEFTGRELEEISLTIKLIRTLGVSPEEEIFKLRDMCQRGEPNFLILGGTVYGENEFVITDIDEDVKHWIGEVKVLSGELKIKLKEYVPRGD